MPPVRFTNAFRGLLSTLGVVPTVDGISAALNPFLAQLPDTVDVTATPGSPPRYVMSCEVPHIRIASGEDGKPVVIELPNPAECPPGALFSITPYQEEGGSGYVGFEDEDGYRLFIPAGIRYQFVAANGNSLSFLNDWRTWGRIIYAVLEALGSLEEDSPKADGSFAERILDLQQRVSTLEE